MYKVAREKTSGRPRLIFAGLLIILLAATGYILHRLPLSLQDIGKIIQLSAGKSSDDSVESWVTETKNKPLLRGTVYDRNLKEVSVSYQLFSLFVDPAHLADKEIAAEQLAQILGLDQKIILDRLLEAQSEIEIADDLDLHHASEIKAVKMAGVRCQVREARYYPQHSIGAYLLGYTEKRTGLNGVEALYDPILQPGEFRNTDIPEVDFRDQKILGRTTTDVVLTIDLELQNRVEQMLRRYREQQGAVTGMALVLDPQSGRILALVTQPSSDPNYFWKVTEQGQTGYQMVFEPYFNRTLLRPLLVHAAAVHRAGVGKRILPATVATPDYGLNAIQLAAYRHVFGLQESVYCLLNPADDAKNSTGTTGNCGNSKLSGVQFAVGLASLLNSGNRVSPYYLHGIYDHARKQLFDRSPDFAQPERVLDPVLGINLRRELLLHSPYSTDKGFLFANSKTFFEKNNGFSEYRTQELLLVAVPKKRPQIMVLLAVDYNSLRPQLQNAVETRDKSRAIKKLGNELLPVLAEYIERQYPAVHPAEKNENNRQRFFIRRRLEMPRLEAAPEQIAGMMPDIVGFSLRKGLQRLNPYPLEIRVNGTGRIVVQNPGSGEPVPETGVCELTLESRI